MTSIAAGVGLLALGIWVLSTGGSVTLALSFGVGALFLFYHGLKGNGITEAGDVTAPMDFITNPAGAIVDAATDKIVDMASEKYSELWGEPKQGADFDPDAAIARYMANRTEPADSAAEPAPVRRGFGRKGL